MTELQPTSPHEARQLFHENRRGDVSEKTQRNDRTHLRPFEQWCENEDVTNLNELTGRNLHEYRIWRKQSGDLTRATLQTQLSTLRVFMRFCESIDAVQEGLHDKIILPSRDGARRTEMVGTETATQILDWLSKFHYASRDHALFTLLWRTGFRAGAAHSLDVDDYNGDEMYVKVRHRPEQGTTLKNGADAERLVALNERTCAILDDYITARRIDVTDDYGRSPLFTTRQGRLTKKTMRRTSYALTRPCKYGDGCPHDRDPNECEAAQQYSKESKCPSSKSPHTIRRGSITHMLKNSIEEPVVSDRCDVSSDVLSKHYDQRTQKERMEVRRDYLDNI